MSGVRTAIVTAPAMLGDLIKRLVAGRLELDVVAELPTRYWLVRRLKDARPDLVIIGLRRNETDEVIRSLLAAIPTARIIAFLANGRGARGFELRLYQSELGDSSPDGVVEFIRRCCSAPFAD